MQISPLPSASRREFLVTALCSGGALAAGPLLWVGGVWHSSALSAGGIGEWGPLQDPDENGIQLPAGFRSRIIATSGQPPLVGGAYLWHRFPDGGATYPTRDRGWIYVSNSEVPVVGGVGALRFDRTGSLVDAYAILSGTTQNCAGGPTPWGTWLSCEEFGQGHVWECDPTGRRAAVQRPALGTFSHEAVAVDPVHRCLYLTEDQGDGRLYRFTPDAYPDLTSGLLEVAEALGADDTVSRPVVWHAVPSPNPPPVDTPTRQQVPQSTPFLGGEGIWWHRGVIHFVTKGDDRLWRFDTMSETLQLVYDDDLFEQPVLTGVDNVVVSAAGDVLVAEDGGSMDLVAFPPGGGILPLLHVVGQDGSEITGPAFSPDATRLYFSSQRGPGQGGNDQGITYEVSGPFLGFATAGLSSQRVTRKPVRGR